MHLLICGFKMTGFSPREGDELMLQKSICYFSMLSKYVQICIYLNSENRLSLLSILGSFFLGVPAVPLRLG